VKFKDADLVGFPWRVAIGEKSLARNEVELKPRGGAMISVPVERAVERVMEALRDPNGQVT
jgi:prolyl-tRNA synthetase